MYTVKATMTTNEGNGITASHAITDKFDTEQGAITRAEEIAKRYRVPVWVYGPDGRLVHQCGNQLA